MQMSGFASSCLTACLLTLSLNTLSGANLRSIASPPPTPARVNDEIAATTERPREEKLLIRVLEPDPLDGRSQKPLPWLGLATEEASETLGAQLQLDPGVGLTVTYVAPESPAAKAGIQKNDVLVELDGQALVHPAQLRKLVQVRKEGDAVRLAYYHAGKKESVSLTLAKAPERASLPGSAESLGGALQDYQGYQHRLRDLYGEAVRDQMKNLQQYLGDLHIEKDQVEKEIRRSVDEARKATEAALRHATNEFKKFGPTAKALEDLARGWLEVDRDATVTINTSGGSVRTMVKADETGTYVIVANPRRHLTVHNKDGKLLFDGEIETPEQQSAVPKEVWQKVEPMADKMSTGKGSLPELESNH